MTRVVALGLAAAVGLSVVASPALAGNEMPSTAGRAGKGPLAATAAARVARLDVRALAAQAPAPAASSDKKPFFKTGKGVAVILLFVGGTAWTIASAKNDRIHSPIR